MVLADFSTVLCEKYNVCCIYEYKNIANKAYLPFVLFPCLGAFQINHKSKNITYQNIC